MTGKWQERAVKKLAMFTGAVTQTVTSKGRARLVFKDNRSTRKFNDMLVTPKMHLEDGL